MDGLEKFSDIFIQRAKELIEDGKTSKDPEFVTAYTNHIFGLEGPTSVKRKLKPSDHFFSKVREGFHEISSAYYCLLDIETYMGRFPYNGTSISKSRHLLYHIANYLNEVYILKERMETYLKIIGRSYRKDHRHNNVLKQTRPLFILIKKSLEDIVKIRGAHVHQSRYIDKELDRLSSLELLTIEKDKDLEIFQDLYRIEYNKLRKEWKSKIKDFNTIIKKLLNYYFDVLHNILVDGNGNLKLPQNYKSERTGT